MGNHFSIADIANFAVVDVGRTSGIDRSKFEHVERWWKVIAARTAVQKGSMVPFPNPMLGCTYIQRRRLGVRRRRPKCARRSKTRRRSMAISIPVLEVDSSIVPIDAYV